MEKLSIRYTTYINCPAETVWESITDPKKSAVYWGHSNVSTWEKGAGWAHVRVDESGTQDVVGEVVEVAKPKLLVLTWTMPGETRPEGPSKITFEIFQHLEITRLTIIHENLKGETERTALVEGWAAVLSNMKTYIETGSTLPNPPWQFPEFVKLREEAEMASQ